MNGDIKLATLSDTDTTNVTGSELVTNGTFASNTTGWTVGQVATLSVSGGQLVVTATGAGYPSANQNLTVVANQAYYFSADIKRGTSTAPVNVEYNDGASGWTQLASNNSTTLTTFTGTFVPTTTNMNFRITMFTGSATVGQTVIADNIIVTLAESDRSVNGNGLQVFGTVTKTAVATGAELVGYSGFSANNYLKQNLDWTIGTGDFTFSFWVNPVAASGSYFHVISIGTESTGGQGSGNGIVLKLNASDSAPYFYTGAGGAAQNTYNVSNALRAGTWSQLVCGRKSGVFYIYINGGLAQTGSSNSFNISDTVMTLGRGIGYGEFVGDTKISLVRISKTAPTAEQIAKMYRDEKHLFQENAKATLYGTSDAVTALAYDDDTELLHVGTSAGRSEFQGLNRVNNTTDAVSAAISASNGFIVEE
jgi:hypothetical protein